MLTFLISAPEFAQQQRSRAALYHDMGGMGERRTWEALSILSLLHTTVLREEPTSLSSFQSKILQTHQCKN